MEVKQQKKPELRKVLDELGQQRQSIGDVANLKNKNSKHK